MNQGPGPRELAEGFLNGENFDRERVIELPGELAKSPTFALGLRVYDKLVDERLIEASERVGVGQKAVLCAYKDPDVPRREGLDRALDILRTECDVENTSDPETLGLAGAVRKRKWERTGNPVELSRSLKLYQRGFMGQDSERDDSTADEFQRARIRKDQGYNAINAAFVADLLASTLAATEEVEAAARHTAEADRIRRLVADELAKQLSEGTKPGYWFVATQLEADFGLGDFDAAKAKTELIRQLPEFKDEELRSKSSWMLQSTATQLARLARLRFRGGDVERPLSLISTLLGDDVPIEAVRSLMLGKVGLALSGGGFRASLYHIGVLARLAELDVLRHVEVISTVSGGSILGVHYYLLLKRALEEKADLEREDYIELVKRLERDFLAGVQTDVRSTLYAGLPPSLSDLLKPREVVGGRLGELYEEVFYWPAFSSEPRVGRMFMDELGIRPFGTDSFSFKDDNWRRNSKVPALVVNATTQNTGHLWQFTTTYAGESPFAIDTDVDTNDRFRRFYYRPDNDAKQEPLEPRRIEVGAAVAASACVPGMFPPTDLGERYEGYHVRLVDGGVHDNQGIVTLLEQDCTHLIVSDACGQMTTIASPEGVAMQPLLRSNEILMERIRQEEYSRIEALRDSGRLHGLLFVHLRRGLAGEAVEWVDCEDPRRPPIRTELLGYGVRREYQQALAGMRTDLDAFSDVESYALMFSGYSMVDEVFSEALPDMVPGAQLDDREQWGFSAVADLMTEHPKRDSRHERFQKLLDDSSELFFREAPSEEAEVLDYMLASVRRAVAWAAIGALFLGVITVTAGFVWGQLVGLRTALGLFGLTAVVAVLGSWAKWRSLRTIAHAAQLEWPKAALPAVAYAGALWAAKTFSLFHLKSYKEQILDSGRVDRL